MRGRPLAGHRPRSLTFGARSELSAMDRSIGPSLRHGWPITACSWIQIVGEVDDIVPMERRTLMIHTVMVRNLIAVAAITIVSIGLSGCDYWPPALQNQIKNWQPNLKRLKWKKPSCKINWGPFRKSKTICRCK